MVGKHSISVWFFVGLLFVIYGALILGYGIYELFVPPDGSIAMARLHINLWWGSGMLLIGAVYILRFRPGRNNDSGAS